MKKFVIGLLALTTVSAFAQSTAPADVRHMVQLSGYEGDQQQRSVDLYSSNGGSSHNTTTNIAMNYAYAFSSTWQFGGLFKSYNNEGKGSAGSDKTTYGVFGYWNLANRLTDTNYLGLKYEMGNSKTNGNTSGRNNFQQLSVEFGHRFHLGNLWGMSYNWSPSAELGVARLDPKHGGTSSSTEVRLNVLKVDVLF